MTVLALMGRGNEELEGSYTTEYRQLDSRISRWTSVDPAADLYYSWSPYSLSMNSPLANSALSGATVAPNTAENANNVTNNGVRFNRTQDLMSKSYQEQHKKKCHFLLDHN
jgi:hypothetical protein